MPLFAEEYLEDRFGRFGARPRAVARALPPVGMEERSGYKQYLEAIEKYRAGSSAVHKAVVDEIRKCADSVQAIANPTERMVAQIECMKNIRSAMERKGFVVYSRRKPRKYRYSPA